MPVYEYRCPGCEVRHEQYFSFEQFDNGIPDPNCVECTERAGVPVFLKRIFSTGAPLVYSTFGSHIDKVGIRQPKEFFDNQLEQQRKATEVREKNELMKNPELRAKVNKKRKQLGEDPV